MRDSQSCRAAFSFDYRSQPRWVNCGGKPLPDTSFPKIPVLLANPFNVGLPLADQFLLRKPFKIESSLFGMPKVLVIGGVAEHACGHDEFRIVSIRMTLGEKMVPRE